MAYGLWLGSTADGRITLHGWTEPHSGRTEHWPPYTLCHRSQLTQRLDDLGLALAPGADLNDLDMRWDVYLTHPNPAALRTRLDAAGTPSGNAPGESIDTENEKRAVRSGGEGADCPSAQSSQHP